MDEKNNAYVPSFQSNAVSAKTKTFLKEAFGGKDSETTSILQYTYQSSVLFDEYPEIAKQLDKIAMDEMHHHKTLAKIMMGLSIDPIIAGRFSFFSGSYLSYVKNPYTMLELDIENENQAICDYLKIVASSCDESLNELVINIIEDEKRHVITLKNLLKQL